MKLGRRRHQKSESYLALVLVLVLLLATIIGLATLLMHIHRTSATSLVQARLSPRRDSLGLTPRLQLLVSSTTVQVET